MKYIISVLFIIFSAFIVSAQNSEVKTETFKVAGNCSMCKKRIEDAAYIKGVKRAEWNKETKELTLTYNSSKTSSETVLQSIAKAGHASEKVTAKEEDYNRLPGCCQYNTNSCND